MDQTIAEVASDASRARADATERFSRHFPPGMTFNDAAVLLETNGFGLLNPTERIFHRWRVGGEEFEAKRALPGFRSNAEIRITIHTVDKKIARLSARYFSTPR